jgi:hypothetical protein
MEESKSRVISRKCFLLMKDQHQGWERASQPGGEGKQGIT